MDPGESQQTIEEFMNMLDAEHAPAAIDTGAALSQRFGVAALSTLIVVDADGTRPSAAPTSTRTITAEA